MAHDLEKWMKPATSAELAEALIRVRGLSADLYGLIKNIQAGNSTGFAAAEIKFLETDQTLFRLINRVGGFDGPK